MTYERMGVCDFINVPEDKRAQILPDGTEETGIVGIRTDEGTFAADGTLICENPNRQPSLFDVANAQIGEFSADQPAETGIIRVLGAPSRKP